MARKCKVRTYKTYTTAARIARKLDVDAALTPYADRFKFLVYGINKSVNGKSVTIFVIGSKDAWRKIDDVFYLVNGKEKYRGGCVPFKLRDKDYCMDVWK